MSTTSPSALTAISAPTVTPCSVIDAVPMPPFIACAMPNSLPTLAPAPAPMLPCASAAPVPAWAASSQAAQPASAPGRMRASPTCRSNSTAAGTMGTRWPGAVPTGRPIPRPSSQRITPAAASSPQALPPDSSTACTTPTRLAGWSKSVSRVPGAAPRTSTPPTAPASASTTLQPVGRSCSVWWPTAMPRTSLMAPGCKELTLAGGISGLRLVRAMRRVEKVASGCVAQAPLSGRRR